MADVSKSSVAFPFAVLAVIASLLVVLGASHGWILCWTNCGETFDALLYVQNFKLYGLAYNLVQDMATSPQLEAHPFLYTHNPNIAGYVFVLLQALGVHSFYGKQLVSIAILTSGLGYVWLAVRAHTGSSILAAITLLLFCVDVEHVLSYGLNPLRAWHWLALFGLIYHVGQIADGRTRWKHGLATLILGAVALGIGYDFLVICWAVCAVLLLIPAKPGGHAQIRAVALIAVLFAIPFCLRQWQVASVIGPQLWWWDVITSAAIKVPALATLVDLPSLAAIDEQYRALNILRPPATPETARRIYMTFVEMFREVVVPGYGLVTVSGAILVGVGVVVCLVRAARRRRGLNVEFRVDEIGKLVSIQAYRTARLFAGLALGIGAGMMFFAPLSFHIYIKHGFPLLAAPLHLAKAILIVLLLHVALKAVSDRRRKRTQTVTASVVIAVLVFDIAAVNATNYANLEPISIAWIDEVKQRRGEPFAVSWIPNSVSVFTDQWSIGIVPGGEGSVAAHIRDGEQPFRRSDLFLFGERDRDVREAQYLKPRFWLYYPIDQNTPFDNAAPKCRKDWTVALASRLVNSQPRVKELRIRRAAAQANGDEVVVYIWGASGPLSDGDELHLQPTGNNAASANFAPRRAAFVYNCIHRTFDARASISRQLYDPTQPLRLILSDEKGMMAASETFMPVAASSVPPLPRPQLSPSELRQMLPDVPVAAQSEGFVIFDLKTLYLDARPKGPGQADGGLR